jgi:hypothetical protein
MIVPDLGPISPCFLTQDDRIAIADGLYARQPVKDIAASIGKGMSTGFELLVELLLVSFRDHDVVRASAKQVAGVLALGVHGVAGHDHARQVGEGLQQRLEAGDLTRKRREVQ